MKMRISIFILLVFIFIMLACKPKIKYHSNGIGSIHQLSLEKINDSLAMQGKQVFENNCGACHKMEYASIGPDISNILWSRKPEWVMNFMLHHEIMRQKDSMTYYLEVQYKENCAFNIDSLQARSILEYLRLYQIWLHETNSIK